MSELEIKKEYKRIAEIAKRLGKCQKFTRKLITMKDDPVKGIFHLPAKKVGREWWITESKIQEWLNSA